MLLALAVLTLTPNPAGPIWRQPQLAMSGTTAVVAFGAANDVYAAVSSDSGTTFGKPVKVGSGGVASLGRHRGPRVVMTGSTIVIAAIAGAKGKGLDGELFVWRSTDLGKTWSKPQKVNDVPGAAREGLHALAAGTNGMLFATWLDLRKKGMRLAGSISKDGGATWSPNFFVYESPDGHVCECCHPSAAIAPDGAIHVMFRNWLGGSRDMWHGVSKDGGKTFFSHVVGQGTWKLNACPMDGGGLAIKADGSVVTSWRRESQIFYTNGPKFEAPGWAGKDSALALDKDGHPVIAWTEGMKVVAFDGTKRDLAPHGAFPSLAASGGVVLAAWEQSSGIAVIRIK